MRHGWVLFIGLLLTECAEAVGEELALFDGSGEAAAYIALDDDLTVYLWGGKPVAYIHEDGDGAYHVFGFNGKHLGWFAEGALWDHRGDAACATKDRMRSTQFEPLKALKRLKPLKSLRELPPLRPLRSDRFADTPCSVLLALGA